MKMTKEEFYNRDYDIKAIEEDQRLVACKKEAAITISVRLVLSAVLVIIKYGVGAGNPQDYTYLFGLPLWASLSYIAIFITLIFSGVLVKKVFKDFSLEDEN